MNLYKEKLNITLDMDDPNHEYAFNFVLECEFFYDEKAGDWNVTWEAFLNGEAYWPQDTFTRNELNKINAKVKAHDWNLVASTKEPISNKKDYNPEESL